MTSLAPLLSIDPLIAEAKERALRRRLMALGAIAVAAAAAIGVTLNTRSTPTMSPLAQLKAAARDRVQMVFEGSSGGVTWATSARGAIRITTDDGRTWRRAPGIVDFRTSSFPEFVDHRHGWSVGLTHLYRTTDGGRTWKRLSVPGVSSVGSRVLPLSIVRGSVFVSPMVGFVEVVRFPFLEHRVELFATHDGGLTWRPRVLPAHARLGSFVSARRGFARSATALYSTADGGRTWSVLRRTGWGVGIPTIFGRTLVEPARVGKLLRFYVSPDRGATWSEPGTPLGPDAGSVLVLSARTWIVGSSSGFYVTTSAGRTWRLVRSLGLPPRWGLRPEWVSRRIGWAIFQPPRPIQNEWHGRLQAFAALRGVLMRTTDGGRHWTPAGPPKPRGQKRG